MPKIKYGGANGNLNNLSKKGANAVSDPAGTYQKSGTIGKIIFVVFILILLIAIIYYIFYIYSSSSSK